MSHRRARLSLVVAVVAAGVVATVPDAVAASGTVGPDASTVTLLTGDESPIITGSGGRYRGVAPDAKLLNGKVLDGFGSGAESWIIAGMEWTAANGADVVNMRLSSGFPSDGTDPMSQAMNRLTAETGTLFVVAAGNTGDLVGSPAATDRQTIIRAYALA